MDHHHSRTYLCHTACPYFPCHPGADPGDFNCLFCFCPLYALGERCGGSFRYTAEGIKDCSACLLPHRAAGYGHILRGCGEIAAALRQQRCDQEGGRP